MRDFAAQGTTVILVEQSVNLALTIAETAYFMEKGEIRFHGPTAELLERPDVLRSVFLEGADTHAATRRADGSVGPTVPATPARVDAPDRQRPRRTATRPAPAIRLGLDGVSKRFGGLAALTDVSLSAAAGEIVGIIGPNGAGKTTLFDAISGFTLADAGTIVLGEGDDAVDITRLPPGRARPARARPLVPGRPAVPVAHRRARRSRSSFERHLEVRDPIGAALHLPFVADAEADIDAHASRSCSSCSASPTSATSSAASSRPAAGASSTSRACSRTARRCCCSTSRRRASRSARPKRSARCCSASASRRARRLLVIEHDVPLLLSIADRLIALDLGEIVAERTARRRRARSHRSCKSYLGTTEAAIARSGARGAS